MPSINDNDLFDFNGHAGEFEDNDYAEAQKAYKLTMGGAIHDLKNRVRTAKVRAELMGASPAEALRAATATIGTAQGHELSSPNAAQPPQALEGDIIDPQVASLEAEVSRLQRDNTRLETAAQRASNLQEQLDERDRLVASKDAEIARLSNLLNRALGNIGTPPAPAPTPGPAPAGPTPTPPRYGQPATPAPATPAPPAAAPAQPATPAAPAPAQPAPSTPPATPAAPSPQTPPQGTSNQRSAGNPGPAASNPNQASTPPTRTMPAQSQRQPQRQPRQQGPGFRARANAFLFGPEPEEPNRNRQSR
jgi:hypothetical protein